MLKTTRTLKRVKYAESLNRLLCLVAVLPVFHACACIGRTKVPTVDKVAAIVLTANVCAAVALNNKRESLEKKLQKQRQNYQSYC